METLKDWNVLIVKQILTIPTLYKSLQNWLLSMKLSYKNDDIQFVCENSKALVYDEKRKMAKIKDVNLKYLKRIIKL